MEVAIVLMDGASAKPNIMNNSRLILFILYESFPYLELIYYMGL